MTSDKSKKFYKIPKNFLESRRGCAVLLIGQRSKPGRYLASQHLGTPFGGERGKSQIVSQIHNSNFIWSHSNEQTINVNPNVITVCQPGFLIFVLYGGDVGQYLNIVRRFD